MIKFTLNDKQRKECIGLSEDRLLQTLSGVGWFTNAYHRSASAYDIAELTGVSHVTARKYLRCLYRDHWLDKTVEDHRPNKQKELFRLNENGRKYLIENNLMLL